ncbi:MAG: hypothetical protein AAFR88_07075 [Pseudomonadota bacterium]
MTHNDERNGEYPDPRKQDIMAGDRRLSRPDASLPDWEVPDTAYRPIPIVWFTAAMLTQLVALTISFWVFASAAAFYTILTAGLVTGLIGAWTWARGMRDASIGWQRATVIMLTAQLGFIVLAVVSRA